MDKLEIAKALLNNPVYSNPGQTTTVYGRAVSDSADGLVLVDMGGETVSVDEEQAIECETTFKVYSGDEVIVSLIGADGSGKTPLIVGVVGRGDQQQNEIDNVKNYFWTDDRGAHVSTIEQSVEGANVLLDSDSLDIRKGESNSENDQKVLAQFASNGAFIAGLNGERYWQIKDLRNPSTGLVTVVDQYISDGLSTSHTTDFLAVEVDEITLGTGGLLEILTEDTDYTVDYENSVITFINVPASKSTVRVTYKTSDGVFSYDQGQNTSNGQYSSTFGKNNESSGAYSEAHGYNTSSISPLSETHGYGTIARGDTQIAIGKLNLPDYESEYSLIVGSGYKTTTVTTENFGLPQSTDYYVLAHDPSQILEVKTYAQFATSSTAYARLRSSNGLNVVSGSVTVSTPFDYDIDFYINVSENGTTYPFYWTLSAGETELDHIQYPSGTDVRPYGMLIRYPRTNIRIVNRTVVVEGEALYWAGLLPNISIFGVKYNYASEVKKDIVTLDWNGTAEFAGGVFAGNCTPNIDNNVNSSYKTYPLIRYDTRRCEPQIWNPEYDKWEDIALERGRIYGNTEYIDITLPAGTLCLLFTNEYNGSTKVYRGHHAYLLSVPEPDLYGTKAIQSVTLGGSSNSGVTLNRPDTSILQIKASSASYYVNYRIVKVLDFTSNIFP